MAHRLREGKEGSECSQHQLADCSALTFLLAGKKREPYTEHAVTSDQSPSLENAPPLITASFGGGLTPADVLAMINSWRKKQGKRLELVPNILLIRFCFMLSCQLLP